MLSVKQLGWDRRSIIDFALPITKNTRGCNDQELFCVFSLQRMYDSTECC